jgi:hypothetical protein
MQYTVQNNSYNRDTGAVYRLSDRVSIISFLLIILLIGILIINLIG